MATKRGTDGRPRRPYRLRFRRALTPTEVRLLDAVDEAVAGVDIHREDAKQLCIEDKTDEALASLLACYAWLEALELAVDAAVAGLAVQ